MSVILALSVAFGGAFVVPAGEQDAVWAEVQEQVRSRTEVIIRVNPLSATEAPAVVTGEALEADAETAPRRRPDRADEATAACIPLSGITGVRLSGTRRLLLYMADRRVVSAAFDRSCPVRGFYSGFYITRTEDGLLCEGRDALHARSGVHCEVASLSETKPAADAQEADKP